MNLLAGVGVELAVVVVAEAVEVAAVLAFAVVPSL